MRSCPTVYIAVHSDQFSNQVEVVTSYQWPDFRGLDVLGAPSINQCAQSYWISIILRVCVCVCACVRDIYRIDICVTLRIVHTAPFCFKLCHCIHWFCANENSCLFTAGRCQSVEGTALITLCKKATRPCIVSLIMTPRGHPLAHVCSLHCRSSSSWWMFSSEISRVLLSGKRRRWQNWGNQQIPFASSVARKYM